MEQIIKPFNWLFFILKRIFLPHSCINCADLIDEKSQTSICLSCLNNFEQLNFVDKAEIERITAKIGADDIKTLWRYNNDLRKLIINFKFNDLLEARKSFVELMPSPEIKGSDILVIPVPIHAKKRRKRKYNQASELAGLWAKKYNLSFMPLALKRTKLTKQIGKSKQEREKQLSQSIVPQKELTGKSVYLIDDILTTGATLHACIKALKQAGATKVICITLAFTPLQQSTNSDILSFNPKQKED